MSSCNQEIAWKEAGFPALQVAINISPNHFLDKDIVNLVKRVIDDTGMIPSELELKMTENVGAD